VALFGAAAMMVLHGVGATRVAARIAIDVLGRVQLARDTASAARLCQQVAEGLSDLIHSHASPQSSAAWLGAIAHRGDRRLLQAYESNHKARVLQALDAASQLGVNASAGTERVARSPRGQPDLCQLESELRLIARRLG
jgi:hypothetical protein